MRLRDYLDPSFVLLDLPPGDVEATLRALVQRVDARRPLPDPERIVTALQERERMHPTVLGSGVAVPHGTVPGITAPMLVIARVDGASAFGTNGEEPVRLILALVSPPDRAATHIKLLARIARLLRHPGMVERMLAAGSAEELLAEIGRVDAEHV